MAQLVWNHEQARLVYGIVTPAHSEAQNLARLASSIVTQVRLPKTWIIAENGSDGATTKVARDLTERYPWVKVLSLGGRSDPVRGAPVVRAFAAAVACLAPEPDVVVKADADIEFDPQYFEKLLTAFERDTRLGIASGARYEQLRDGSWRADWTPHGYAEAQCRAYRWRCLMEISPLEERMGWDTIDEVSARLMGWRTRGFREFGFRHHRPVGTRDGSRVRAWANQGRTAHYLGYRPSYLGLRTLRRMASEPAAVGLLIGYAERSLQGKPRHRERAIVEYISAQQRMRSVWRTVAQPATNADD
jgi:glycosyltransferase involved in cell wall biosynthesis